METSQLIARFLGPVMLVAGASMFLNQKQIVGIFEDFMKSLALIYLAGVLAFVMGIAVVTFHNEWVAGWPVIITVFGWGAILGGIMRMVFPGVAIDMGKWMIGQPVFLTVSGVLNVLLGAFLTYKGFLS